MPARQIENKDYVAQRIQEIFGAEHVQYRLAQKAGHQFHMFDNGKAVYTACHIATGRHEQMDFWLAFGQLWSNDGKIAVEGDAGFASRINHGTKVYEGELGDAVVLDRDFVEKVGGDEQAAEVFLNSLDERTRYLGIVGVPHGERAEMALLNIAAMVSYDFDLQVSPADKTAEKTVYSTPRPGSQKRAVQRS